MPKKIAYIYKGPYPFEIRAQKICESLADNGYEVTLICKWNNEELQQELINGVNVIRAGYKLNNNRFMIHFPYNPYWRKSLKKILYNLKPDLIINREVFLMTENVPIAKKLGIPIIVDMAENYPAAIKNFRNYYNSLFKRVLFKKLKLMNLMERYAVNNAKGIVLVCQENRDRIIKEYKYESYNTEIVHNTPIEKWFNQKTQFNSTPKIFNYMGYISLERNLENFIKGFDMYCESSVMDLEFRIYGSGTELENLIKIANTLKHKDKIHFYGEYAHKNLCKHLNESDIGVLPYVNDEFINTTISNKLFDYMAMGKPVLCSSAKPMIRIIEETGCGIYSDCSTAEECLKSIEQILTQYNAGMSDNAYNAFKNKYNWSVDEKVLLEFVGRYING